VERVAHPFDQFGVLAAGDPLAAFQHRHAAAEARVGLCHLQPDRPAAEDHQVAGRLLQIEDRLVGQPGHAVQARQLRHDGGGAGGDHAAAEAEAPASGLDGVRAQEVRRGLDHFDAHAAEARRGVVRRDARDGAVDVRAHAGPVHLGRRQAQAEAPRAPRFGRGVGGGEQRLGRDAAVVEAVPAHPVALHHRNLQPEPGGDGGHGQPGGAGADHHHVEVRHVETCPS
jgi:hypothetical protein